MKKIFVYGTLKEGGTFSKIFDKLRIKSEKAKVIGFDMFNFNYFPAVVRGYGEVYGELHSYKEHEYVLEMMDAIEGYRGKDYDNLYRRTITKAITEDGEEVEAIIYLFDNKIPFGTKKVSNGIWPIN